MFWRLKPFLATGAALGAAAAIWTLASLGADVVRADEPLVPNAKITIKDAVRAAEAVGGKVESARFGGTSGGRWEIGVAGASAGERVTYLVDPNSGEVKGHAPGRQAAGVSAVSPANAAEAKPAGDPDGGLARAISLAEKRTHGAAFEAHAEEGAATPAYIVGLSTLEGRKDVRVTAAGDVTVE